MDKVDILNLEWPNSERDLHIVMPILIYLNKKYGLSYKMENIFNGYFYLLKYKPKMLLISNFSGADINHEIVKFAYQHGIKVVSLISEGNVQEKEENEYLWGWNKEKRLYLDKLLLWSYRSKKMFLDIFNELNDKLEVSGATGFDRYKLLKFVTKKEFLEEEKLNYKKVIGIAGWGFDDFFNENKIKNIYANIYTKEQIEMHKKDFFLLTKYYKHLIENNRNILFICKQHPSVENFNYSEFKEIKKEPNVFFVDNSIKYGLGDLINISDIWIGYETMTALEAWLLDKETFLINPTTSEFKRNLVHKGSPIVYNDKEAQLMINEFYNKGYIQRFSKLKSIRKELIKEIIGWDDGRNHIRAAEEIMKIYNLPDRKIKFNLNLYLNIVNQTIKLFLSKTFLKNKWWYMNSVSDMKQKYQYLYNKAIKIEGKD